MSCFKVVILILMFCCVDRCFKRHSRAALNRQLEMVHFPTPPQLRLFDYLQKRKERKPAPSIDLKISKAGNVRLLSPDMSSIYVKYIL